MLILLQISVLSLACLATAVGFFVSWLGLAPELDFLSYLKSIGVLSSLLGMATLLVSLIAYILGWNPEQKILQRFRVSIVVPAFTSPVILCELVAILIGLFVAALVFLMNFARPVAEDVVVHLWTENFAQADRSIAGSNLSSHRIADLAFVNDSLRQVHFRTTGDPDADLCRIYLSYFSARRRAFQAVWWRYLYGHAIAACLEVAGDLRNALATYRANVQLAQWLTDDEVRRAKRRIAAIYFRDSGNQTDIQDESERLKRVIALLAPDPDITAKRMRGVAQYLLGNYAEAAKIWRDLIKSLPRNQLIERKKLLNNIALAHGALRQYELAITSASEGLKIRFSNQDEAERREQIRLLATMAILKTGANECTDARAAWDDRNELKQQEPSPCSALIAAQVMSCSPFPSEQAQIINSLLLGTGQSSTTVINPTREELAALLDQAERKFAQCYIGLDFDTESVRKAVTSQVSQSSQ